MFRDYHWRRKMKEYEVQIEAEDEKGNKIELTEFVSYPNQPSTADGAVKEGVREAQAVDQVRRRKPHFRNIKAKWSRHV